MERTYDRVPHWDPRNENFQIRELIGTPQIREKVWALPECLNQGQEGACVGFGWTHELLADPVRITDEDPFNIYHLAQQLDDTPGEAYSGTSVLAGAKAVQQLGHMTEYRWATTVDDVLATISNYGPVVIGVNWYEGMERTDSMGFVRVQGRVMGGHCVCLRGVLRDSRGWTLVGRNSWGRAWGRGGDFKLTPQDLGKLLAEDGEVCVPVVRVPETPPAPAPSSTHTVAIIDKTTRDTVKQDLVQVERKPSETDAYFLPQGHYQVMTSNGESTCEGPVWILWDTSGFPYPITPDEFDKLYIKK